MIIDPPSQNPSLTENQASEAFGKTREATFEGFGKFHAPKQRKDSHSVSVRDAAKMFEAAGVTRTERSVINWCWPNRQGLTRLDAYFDPNDRKYYITQESIDMAIKEELSKAQATPGTPFPKGDEPLPNASETVPESPAAPDESSAGTDELKKQVFDLNITNRAKDMYIERLHKERDAFAVERKEYIDQLLSATHRVGELETRLLQLEGPKARPPESPEPVSRPDPVVG